MRHSHRNCDIRRRQPVAHRIQLYDRDRGGRWRITINPDPLDAELVPDLFEQRPVSAADIHDPLHRQWIPPQAIQNGGDISSPSMSPGKLLITSLANLFRN